MNFLLERPIFRGELLVLRRVEFVLVPRTTFMDHLPFTGTCGSMGCASGIYVQSSPRLVHLGCIFFQPNASQRGWKFRTHSKTLEKKRWQMMLLYHSFKMNVFWMWRCLIFFECFWSWFLARNVRGLPIGKASMAPWWMFRCTGG